MKTLSPSLLSADFSQLSNELEKISNAGAKYIHLDIMDGHFVPNISFGAPILKSLKGKTDLVFDVHLMIDEPARYLADFANAGADILNVHYETCVDIVGMIDKIHALGCKAGVTIKPDTPVQALIPVLDKVDMVLVMTVYPGFSGQKFIPEAVKKIPFLVKTRKEKKLNFDIEIDGGISLKNLRDVMDAGVDIVVAGSAVFGAEDPQEAAEEFMKIIREYE